MEDKLKGKNRRSAERKEVAFTLIYGVEAPYTLRVNLGLTDDLDALMLDLSDLGMAIITEVDLPKGTQLYIKFNLRNLSLYGEKRSRNMVIVAEVVSQVDLGNGNYRIGMRFDKISDEDKSAISDFVKRSR